MVRILHCCQVLTKNKVFNFDKDDASPASWKCSEEWFSQQVKMRDPLKLGSVYDFVSFNFYVPIL